MSRTEDIIKRAVERQEALEKSLREGTQPAAVSPTGATTPGAPATGRIEAMQLRRAPIVARSAESVDRDEEKRREREARKQAERAQEEAEKAAREAAEKAAAAPPKYVLPPDMAQVVDYGKVFDYSSALSVESAVRSASRELGMTPERLKEVAAAQGVSLDDIYNARLKGRTYDEYARAAKERGVMGFLPVEEREKNLDAFAKDIDDSKAGVASDKPIALKESGASAQVILGTSTALPELAKEGEHAHTLASMLVDSLLKQDRPSELYDLYGRKTATGATQQYVEDRVKDLVRSTNLRADTPDFDERMRALRRRAFNEVLAYKTIGMWTPVITAMDVEAVEGRRDPTLWEAATTPNIEIIGVNNKRQAIYRMESPVGVVMRALDLPQSAVVGAISGQGAARGVQTGANFLEFALDATEGQSALVRVPAVAAGLAASIFAPDALSTGAAALKGVRAVSQARRVAKLAPRAVELMEEVATARNAGRYADAAKAEVKLRDEFPAVADDLDRKDARMAESIDIIDPKSDILNEDLASLLGSRIPLTSAREAANYRPYLHPSRRRQVLEGTAPSGTTTTFADYGDLFDTERHLKAVADARTDYMTNGPKTVEAYAAARIRGGVRSVFAQLPEEVKAAVTVADMDKLADALAAKAAQALSDPNAFAKDAKALIKTTISGTSDNEKKVRAALYKNAGNITRKVDSLRGADIKALQSADLALFDRMQNAVTANNESRAAAAALLRDQLAENAKIIVQPMNIFDQVAVKTPDGKPIQLTEGGHILLFSIRKAAPNMSFEDAYAAAAMIDAVIRAQAMKRGIDPYELYKNVFPDLRKGTSFDMERFLKAAAGKGPAPSSATPPAALPFEVSVSARSALEATPPIPAGYKAQDIKKVQDAKKVIKAAFGDVIPEVKLTVIEPGTQKTVESVSVVVGDARIIIDRTPNVEEFNVIATLGEGAGRTVETVLKVKGRGRAQAVGQRAIEALMNARVKAKGPAIVGAPVKDAAAAKAAPPTAPAAAPTPTPAAPAPAAVTPPPAVVQPAPAVTPAPPAPAAKPSVLPALADTVDERKEQLRQYLRKNPGINLGILFNKFNLTPEDMRKIYAEVRAERVPAAVPAPAPAEAPTPAPIPAAVPPTPAPITAAVEAQPEATIIPREVAQKLDEAKVAAPPPSPAPKGYSVMPNKGNNYEMPWTAYLSGKDSPDIRKVAAARDDLGVLITPYTSSYVKQADAYPFFAVDNGVFAAKGFDPQKFEKLIGEVAALPEATRNKLLFVVAPDVLIKNPDGSVFGDAKGTLELFKQWGPKIRAKGLPVALVAQNGLEDMIDDIPWDDFDVLFIGGSTEWKIGDFSYIADPATRRATQDKWTKLFQAVYDNGKPIHMGRVSGPERLMRGGTEMGAATVDGTMLAVAPDQMMGKLTRMLDDLNVKSRARLADQLYPDTGSFADEEDFIALAQDPRIDVSDLDAFYRTVDAVAPGLVVNDTAPGLVKVAKAEKRRVYEEVQRLRKGMAPPTPAKRKRATSAKAAAEAAPVAEGAPDVFPSIERDARRVDIDRAAKKRQADVIIARLYGDDLAAGYEDIPSTFRVNAAQRLRKAEEGLAAGRITQEQFNKLVSSVRADFDDQARIQLARGTRDLRRGPDWVRSRLLMAKDEGVIDEAGADLADWFIQQNPRMANDLAVSIRRGAERGSTAGLYDKSQRIVVLFKERGSELTATHEVLHHTERMLPDDLRTAIRKEWGKRLAEAMKTASPQQLPLLSAMLTGTEPARVMKAFEDGALPIDFYQYANPSEFWAVNASRIVSGRYAAFNRGLVARAKQWLTEFVQKAKSVFRLQSDAPLIRGLDAVLKGDGTFVSKQMLSEGGVFRSIETQAPVPSGITQDALRQVSPTGEIKGAVETLADGKTILYLFEGADASTIIHEAGHILRRSILDNDDMGAITDWIKSQGVNVGHEFGEFVGGAADIEKAEEMFAQAFERYAREGIVPPSAPLLKTVFEALKQALNNIYKVTNDPVIGVDLNPAVRAVFDKMFEGATTTANPTILEKVRRTLLGKAGPGFEGVLTTISREATRKGIPGFTEEDVFRLVDEAKKNGVPSNQPVLRFQVKVNGKKDWSADDLAEAQTNAEIAHLDREARRIGIRLDLTARGKGKTPAMIIEDKATEALRSLFAAVEGERGVKKNVRAVGRVIVGSFLGGDMVADKGGALLRNAPPALRAVLDGVERVVQMAIGDTITLVNAAIDTGKDTELVKYLVGQSRVTRQSGRPILSAGHNHMNAVLGMFNGLFSKLSDEELVLLQGLADALNSNNPGTAITRVGFNADGSDFRAADAAAEAARNSIITAYTKTLNATQQPNKSELGATLAGAVRNAVQAVQSPRPSHELKLMETLLYLTKKTSRNGAYFAGSDEDAVRMILKEVKDVFDDESSRRVAVLIGSFGGADQAKRMLVNMNLGISADAERNFKQWVVGRSVDEKYKPEIQRIINRYGFNPNFVADPVLGVNFYLPEMARERLANALARGNYREAATVMTSAADAFNMLYRYMKLRMTRGSFVTKGRYFMMNTADHGTALGTIVGLGVGAASTARLLPQNLLVIPPLVGQVIDLPGRIPGSPIPRNFTERVRRGLQAAGDRGAWAVGQIFSTGKYRIEVNPILEGVDGTFRAGGNVYTYRDVRNIAVEEGIFSSFDTSQLQSLILKEGQLQLANTQIFRTPSLRAAPGSLTSATAKLNNFFAELSDSVADLAEAWGERERLGAMVTLMEAGYSPRVAARLTIDALFDYAQTMTKNDRGFLVSVLFPFWAFQKNANAQVFNLIFSPAGAYRAMVIKRMKDRTADLASELLYDEVGSEYGIDVKSMPPELQDTYYGIMTAFYDAYDGNPPEDAKRAMRLILTGRAVGVESGQYFETAYKLMEQRGAGAFADVNKFGQYVSLRPEKSARMSTFRDRTGIAVPFPRTEAVRQVYAYLGDNHTYMEIFWPESTFEAGMKYHTQVLAGMVLLGAKGIEMVVPGTGMEEEGIEGVSLANVLEPVVSVERSPILGPILPSILTGQPEGATPPRRIARPLADTAAAVVEIHPAIAKTLSDAYAVNFFRTPKDADPFIVGADGKLPQLTDEEVERIRKLNDKAPGLGVAKDERIYMVGGVFSTVLYNSPVGELNDLLLRWESEPLARADIRGEILEWAKIYGGVDVSVVSASKTMRAEEPTKLKESKKF